MKKYDLGSKKGGISEKGFLYLKTRREDEFGDLGVDERIYTIGSYRKMTWESGLDSAGSVTGCSEGRHEPSHLLRCGEFTARLSDYQLLKNDCSMGLSNMKIEWIASLQRISVVLGLNIDLQTFPPKREIVLQISPRPVPSMFFLIYYSLIIIFHATQCVSLNVLLNKTKNKQAQIKPMELII